MEAKKSVHADIAHKRPLYFSVGLLLSLGAVTTAFEWKTVDNQIDLAQEKSANVVEELIEVPPTQQLQPPPPVIQQPQIVEVPDEVEINENLNIEFDVEAPRVDLPVAVAEPAEEETDEIFTIVEEAAMPVGGMTAFYKYLQENMRYPAVARRNGVEGKVMVQFVVGKDGTINEVKVLRGIGAGCDEEAVRVMEKAPKWNAGKQRGKPVRQRCIVPIIFSF
ncbi:MAG: energy transducer TonB [Flammeovirgaceae bacterium]